MMEFISERKILNFRMLNEIVDLVKLESSSSTCTDTGKDKLVLKIVYVFPLHRNSASKISAFPSILRINVLYLHEQQRNIMHVFSILTNQIAEENTEMVPVLHMSA
jgi:hypothetical protein